MQRDIYKQLLRWKNKKTRKPLILNGARQVGKTYILREFGEKNIRKSHSSALIAIRRSEKCLRRVETQPIF